MEKNLDRWSEIADLIKREKKNALDDFYLNKFAPGQQSAREPLSRFRREPVLRPLYAAVAASILLVAGLVLFWMGNGSWRSVSTAPALEHILAGSFLYNIPSEPKAKTPAPHAVSSFFSQFSAWSVEAGLNPAVAADTHATVYSLPIEQGDPADVQRRMKKVIQENSIEQMLVRFCQICKEV